MDINAPDTGPSLELCSENDGVQMVLNKLTDGPAQRLLDDGAGADHQQPPDLWLGSWLSGSAGMAQVESQSVPTLTIAN